MAKRPPKPATSNWLTPYLTVGDAKASLDFYARAFGFEASVAMPGPDGESIMHAEMSYKGGVVVMFAAEGPHSPHQTPKRSGVDLPVNLYVYCDDVDQLTKRAREAGAVVLSEPQLEFWGDRISRLRDRDGYTWTFATNVADFDPSKMPK